jgi:hypothetical protein
MDGLTLTLTEGGVGVAGVDGPPPQPAKKANEVNAHETAHIHKLREVFRDIGHSSRFISYLVGNVGGLERDVNVTLGAIAWEGVRYFVFSLVKSLD